MLVRRSSILTEKFYSFPQFNHRSFVIADKLMTQSLLCKSSPVYVSQNILWFCVFFSGVKLSPLDTAATSGLLYKPQMIDEGDCGAIGGIKIGRGNWSTRRKPAPASLRPPQIPHDQTRARTPGHRGGKPATNRLSYGAAYNDFVLPILDNL
jgi:hypothetical protein